MGEQCVQCIWDRRDCSHSFYSFQFETRVGTAHLGIVNQPAHAMKKLCSVLLFTGSILTAQAGFTAHEWGTFTTVSGSDGRLLTGLQVEEESLPSSVKSHARIYQPSPFQKGLMQALENVTVKMETPVIYFYTEQPFHASVNVGFHGGSISQWYPSRSGGEVEPKGPKIDFSKKFEGSIAWEVDVTPPAIDDNAQVMRGDETPNWIYPRLTDSALVRTKEGEAEKYLFYRGLGNFEPPATFSMNGNDELRVSNKAGKSIPAFYVFQSTSEGVKTLKQNALAAGNSATVSLSNLKTIPHGQWSVPVYKEMTAMLENAGLHHKEAEAMVQTWWKSYFQHQGLRVFWILPDESVESILPLSIKPAPDKIVRVLVGRSEVLTPQFEDKLKEDFRMAAENEKNSNPWASDRFFQAYVKRVSQLPARTAAK